MSARLVRWVALLLVLPVSGCGYALLGRSISVDPSIKRIGVPLFKDRTGRAGLDQRITDMVLAELQKRGRFEVVGESEGVDALVEGELLSYSETPVGFAPGTDATTDVRSQASRYEIRLVAKVTYGKVGVADPLWASDAFSVSDNYEPDDTGSGDSDSDQALERLATAFARQLVADMLEAF